MKSIVLIASILSAQISFACVQQEAQFIGNVKNFQSVGSNCSYGIDFTMFNSSFVCPLDIDEVSTLRFADKSCQLKDGDQVSGVMVKQDDSVVIE